MRSWSEFRSAAPEAAALFEARLAATGLGLLATTRPDGFPRISPIEPSILADQVFIGMMPDAQKSRDLRRDPRCCLHSATEDKDVGQGDVKLFARAVEITDADERHAWAVALKDHNGIDAEAMGGFDLFALDVVGSSALRLGGPDHLAIHVWKAGQEERLVKKY